MGLNGLVSYLSCRARFDDALPKSTQGIHILSNCVSRFINIWRRVSYSSISDSSSLQKVFEVLSDSFIALWQSTCSSPCSRKLWRTALYVGLELKFSPCIGARPSSHVRLIISCVDDAWQGFRNGGHFHEFLQITWLKCQICDVDGKPFSR